MPGPLQGQPHPPLACTLRGLAAHALAPADSARGLLGWLARAGAKAAALDATHPELRPRSLDRSARRDLAATLRRAQLALAGIDIFVPAAHLAEPATADRALAAILRAIELAGELRDTGASHVPVVAFDLPDEPVPGAVASIASAAERAGVVAVTLTGKHTPLRKALDLDALADTGASSAAVVGALTGPDLAQVRWGGPRPERRIDLLSVHAALAVRTPPVGVVVDLSRAADPAQALPAALAAWSKAAPAF